MHFLKYFVIPLTLEEFPGSLLEFHGTHQSLPLKVYLEIKNREGRKVGDREKRRRRGEKRGRGVRERKKQREKGRTRGKEEGGK